MSLTSTALAIPLVFGLLSCTACKQQWAFAPPGYASLRPEKSAGDGQLPYGGGDTANAAVSDSATTTKLNSTSPSSPPPSLVTPAAAAEPAQAATAPASKADAIPATAPSEPRDASPSLRAELDAERGDIPEAPPIGPPMLVPLTDDDELALEKPLRPRLGQRIGIAICNSWTDQSHFYSRRTFRDFSIALGGAAILANTQLDQEFRDWYQNDVRSRDTDRQSRTFKKFGEGKMMIPIFAGMAVAGRLLDDWPLPDMLGEYGSRVTRAYWVGAPPLLLTQAMLGAARPNDIPGRYSHWKPFEYSHGASGHAFIGSVPFITAAHMTDNWALKGGLYFASALGGWSRINDDKHYLSQVCLGWYMGYLAARAVNDTQAEDTRFAVIPAFEGDGAGITFVYRH